MREVKIVQQKYIITGAAVGKARRGGVVQHESRQAASRALISSACASASRSILEPLSFRVKNKQSTLEFL